MQASDTSDWLTFQDPAGFSIEHPPGWVAERDPSGDACVTSPDGRAFVRISQLRGPIAATAAEIVRDRLFPAAAVLLQPFGGEIESPEVGMAACCVRFRYPGGESAMALVTCETFANGAIVAICAAREPNGLGIHGPILWAIKRSFAGDSIRGLTDVMLASMTGDPLEYAEMPNPPRPDIFAEYIGGAPSVSGPAEAPAAGSLPIPQVPSITTGAGPTAARNERGQVLSRPGEGPTSGSSVAGGAIGLTGPSVLAQFLPPAGGSSRGAAPGPNAPAHSPPASAHTNQSAAPGAGGSAGPRPVSQPPPGLAQRPPLTFVRFNDPQAAAFTLDVPAGWQARGGLFHPGLGDRRIYAEVLSPDNISVLFGDPNCPQVFYSNPMAWGEGFFTYPQGTTFLNLRASGKKLAQYYLKSVAPQRFGAVQITGDRDRSDLAAESRRTNPQFAGLTITAHEVTFRAGGRSGHCVGYSFSTGGSYVGDNWMGNVIVWLTPSGLDAIGEQVAKQMVASFKTTPRFNQIANQDERIIANNGAAAVMMQQQIFAAQQVAHFQQEQMGNQIVGQYWEQQRAHEAQIRSWEHNQSVNDGIFQRGSDAMLGVERLYDPVLGREYSVTQGSEYYWLDAASGTVVGTTTETPPDYNTDYRLLKRL